MAPAPRGARRRPRLLAVLALTGACACNPDPGQDTETDTGTGTGTGTTGCDNVPWYRDGDADGFGAGPPLMACAQPPNYVPKDGDCDDTDPERSPDEVEVCDGKDNDCDGLPDELSPQNQVCGECVLYENEGINYAFCLADPSLARPWQDARDLCFAAFGGDLVSIGTSLDQLFVESRLLELATTETFWIGLNDLDVEGDYLWSDGTAFGYSRWGLGQPDHAGPTEDCVEFLASDIAFGLWNDIDCGKLNYPICEAKAPAP